jgi:hypothetical protein
MNGLILNDADRSPDVFQWNGPVDRGAIDKWVKSHGWKIPEDLLDLWTITGGGEIFESERFLPPLASTDGRDEIVMVTRWCLRHGLPESLVVFHEGLGFTAVRCLDGAYVSIDGDLRISGEYRSLERWYVDVLRREYAERYCLV